MQSTDWKEIERVLNIGTGEPFYIFTKKDGKKWLIPTRNLRTGLSLYLPSSRKGLLLKMLLRNRFLGSLIMRCIGAKIIRCELRKELFSLFCELFDSKKIEFSIFSGTPSVHQKMTIQLSIEQTILGYCKVTSQPNIWKIFEHEYSLLQDLADCKVEGIPKGLYCRKTDVDFYVFVQSTIKSINSRYLHNWHSLHSKFLSDLHDKTKQMERFEETDYCQILSSLKQKIDWFDNDDREIIGGAINYVRSQYEGKMVEFSMFQGDFTPWNMFVEKGRLFVYDWEYAINSCPPELDRFHFFLQVQIFKKHHNANRIWNEFCKMETQESNYGLLEYLLLILSLYLNRSISQKDFRCEPNLPIWIELVKKARTDQKNETNRLFSSL